MTPSRRIPTLLQFIVFAATQAQAAERFGVSRNEACRNLKVALHQHWQHKTLRMHGDARKEALPRSRAAVGKARGELVVEHVVPLQVIVNLILGLKRPTELRIKRLLERLYIVRTVTKREDKRLRSAGLRSRMPEGWDRKDPWARYRSVGIRLVGGFRHRLPASRSA